MSCEGSFACFAQAQLFFHSKGPLQLAMFYGHENVTLAILKDNKEFINLPDDQQGSTLHLAAKYDLVNIIEYLLER